MKLACELKEGNSVLVGGKPKRARTIIRPTETPSLVHIRFNDGSVLVVPQTHFFQTPRGETNAV